VLAALLALDRDRHDVLTRLLARCADIDEGEIADAGGLYDVLTSEQMLEGDVAAERAGRRAEEGARRAVGRGGVPSARGARGRPEGGRGRSGDARVPARGDEDGAAGRGVVHRHANTPRAPSRAREGRRRGSAGDVAPRGKPQAVARTSRSSPARCVFWRRRCRRKWPRAAKSSRSSPTRSRRDAAWRGGAFARWKRCARRSRRALRPRARRRRRRIGRRGGGSAREVDGGRALPAGLAPLAPGPRRRSKAAAGARAGGCTRHAFAAN